jgi:hypothetical protein
MSTPTAKAWVASCLSHIGLACGAIARPYSSTPFWSHAIGDYAIGAINMPSMVISYIHSKWVLYWLDNILTLFQAFTPTFAVVRSRRRKDWPKNSRVNKFELISDRYRTLHGEQVFG